MENKYFTPDITDIHVGYECEVKLTHPDYTGGWSFYKFGYDIPKDIILVENGITIKRPRFELRTAYLTKEQIEADGWGDVEEYRDGGTLVFKKKIAEQAYYELTFRGENIMTPSNWLIITKVWHLLDTGKRLSKTLFDGECKSVNELRQIEKLLRI